MIAPDTSRQHEGRMALNRAYKLLSPSEAAKATAHALVMAYGPEGAEAVAHRAHEIIDRDEAK